MYVIRFERELEALRKELAEATARSGRSTPVSIGEDLSRITSDEELSATPGSPVIINRQLAPSPDELSLASASSDKKQD